MHCGTGCSRPSDFVISGPKWTKTSWSTLARTPLTSTSWSSRNRIILLYIPAGCTDIIQLIKQFQFFLHVVYETYKATCTHEEDVILVTWSSIWWIGSTLVWMSWQVTTSRTAFASHSWEMLATKTWSRQLSRWLTTRRQILRYLRIVQTFLDWNHHYFHNLAPAGDCCGSSSGSVEQW